VNKTNIALDIFRPVAVGVGIFAATAAIGLAQTNTANPCAPGTAMTPSTAMAPAPAAWNSFDPSYNDVAAWNNAWESGAYDRNHVMLGTVDKFATARLTMSNSFGDKVTVDLKEGTVIRPTGATPTAGQRVAVFGYWSNGTFIANRVILHG
jgi:hypothetical protein